MATHPDNPSRVAVVTGAARGIGLGITSWFLARGWRVAMLDIDAVTLNAAHDALQVPEGALAIHCDVSSPEQVQRAVDHIAQVHGRIDALVNNAGIAIFKKIGDTAFDEWRSVMATNLDGA